MAMMTGYTAPVVTGETTSAKEYLMRVIRAFGVTVNMRDEPMDAEITEDKLVDDFSIDHHQKALDKATAELDRLRALTARQWFVAAWPHLGYTYSSIEWRSQRMDSQRRVAYMLDEIKAWDPPEAYDEVKKFAMDQLMQTLKSNQSRLSEPYWQNAISYRKSTLEYAERDVVYHAEKLANAKARNAERLQFFRDFVESISALD